MLDMISRLYAHPNSEESLTTSPRLATYTTLLFCHAIRCLYSPSSILYPLISQFLLQRPEYDPADPPMLYSLLYSSLTSSGGRKEGSWRRERLWLIRFLADGMISSKDWVVLQRRHTWDLLASVFETYQEDRVIKLGILKVKIELFGATIY
jgi:nucleolar pre-ribosomal-associated protein 1